MRRMMIVTLGLAPLLGCGSTPEDPTTPGLLTGVSGIDASTGAATDPSTGAATDPSTGAATDPSTGASTGLTATGNADSDSSGSSAKFDVGPMSEGEICVPDELPEHELLGAFLLAYPPDNMPKTLAAVQGFMPQADGHLMAWADVNTGGELIDPGNGGVIEANIEMGRALSRAEAELSIPAGGMIIDTRDEPVIIDDFSDGGGFGCLGVGWAWGSLLFEELDGSIGELVYLYVGYCWNGNEDVEVFFYSDESVLICEPPA